MELFKSELIDLWDVRCPKCHSEILNKNGKYRGRQRFICLDCGNTFTTYSKTILDSTKLSEDQWIDIINGVIDNFPLQQIHEDTGVSLISLSKIRRKIISSLYDLNQFDRLLKKHYYNAFDTSTIFIPNVEQKNVFYKRYNNDIVIAYIQYHETMFVSKCFSTHDFNLLLSSMNYPSIEFIPYKEIYGDNAKTYIEKLLKYLKSFRGIKKDLIGYYTNLFDFCLYVERDNLIKIMFNQVTKYKKNKVEEQVMY